MTDAHPVAVRGLASMANAPSFQLNIIGFVPTLLYFSYSFLIALTFWMLTGTIGFYAAYFFLRRIYGAVKID